MQAADYYNSRPRKATGAGVLFFNAKGEMLIVKPTYLDRWLWVGGGIEDNETPLQAAIRESKEEIGINPKGLKLAFVQYRPPKPDGQNELIHFVFAAEAVNDDFLATIKLAHEEIAEAKFVPVSELSRYVSAQRAKAVRVYIQNRNRGGLYIEGDSLRA
jgi:8-oxo-dGTP diphosphatase